MFWSELNSLQGRNFELLSWCLDQNLPSAWKEIWSIYCVVVSFKINAFLKIYIKTSLLRKDEGFWTLTLPWFLSIIQKSVTAQHGRQFASCIDVWKSRRKLDTSLFSNRKPCWFLFLTKIAFKTQMIQIKILPYPELVAWMVVWVGPSAPFLCFFLSSRTTKTSIKVWLKRPLLGVCVFA